MTLATKQSLADAKGRHGKPALQAPSTIAIAPSSSVSQTQNTRLPVCSLSQQSTELSKLKGWHFPNHANVKFYLNSFVKKATFLYIMFCFRLSSVQNINYRSIFTNN